MSKRKIVIFKFVPEMGMYEEQVSLTVTQHKGLPEIEKNAKREIAKMQRVSEGKYGYIVMQNGQSLTEFKYD